MKRLLSCMLALVMTLSMSVPVLAVEPVQVPGTEAETKSTGSVQLKYLNPSEFKVSENDRIFNRQNMNEYTMEEDAELVDGKLRTIPTPPEIEGWTFDAWYTAPVSYAFWGDKTGTKYSDYESIPEGFTYNLEGKEYADELIASKPDTDVGGDANWSATLNTYWIWLYTTNKLGNKVTLETDLNGVQTLYAHYKPTTVTYKMYSQGWKRTTGALIVSKQYGTPFGPCGPLGGAWDGYVFDGWFTEDGRQIEDFYEVPKGEDLYAHWHDADHTEINQDSYKENGYEPVTSISLRDDDVGKGQKELGDLIQFPDGKGTKNIIVRLNPYDCGVTELNWKLEGDEDIVTITQRHTYKDSTETYDKLAVRIDATGKEGIAKLIVSTKDGTVEDSVVIDTTGHKFDKTEIVQYGTCSVPTIYRHTCVNCGKVELQETYKEHTWAYRDIPATCTTPHYWEHYCKVCGETDPEGNQINRGPATGEHQWKATNTVPQNCVTNEVTYTCETCGTTEVRNETVVTNPSENSAFKTVPSNGGAHTWGEWEVTKAPTSKATGQKIHTCTLCGTSETRTLSKLKANTITASDFTKSVSAEAQSFSIGAKANGGAKLTYTSDNKSITVDSAGKATIEANYAGKAAITIQSAATETYDAASKTITVTVTLQSAAAETYDAEDKPLPVMVTNQSAATETYDAEDKPLPATADKAENTITASNVTKTASAKAQSFSIGANVNGGAKLTYASDNNSVTVDSVGKVTVKANFVGKATITIKSAATDAYNAASRKIAVTVNPAKASLSSVKNLASKKMQVSWKKSSGVTGYQIRYSRDKKFKSGVKTVTITKNRTISTAISKLTKGKTYYVQIRTYKTVSGAKYCSGWSGSKSVKISK